jgi:hypothetical protein
MRFRERLRVRCRTSVRSARRRALLLHDCDSATTRIFERFSAPRCGAVGGKLQTTLFSRKRLQTNLLSVSQVTDLSTIFKKNSVKRALQTNLPSRCRQNCFLLRQVRSLGTCPLHYVPLREHCARCAAHLIYELGSSKVHGPITCPGCAEPLLPVTRGGYPTTGTITVRECSVIARWLAFVRRRAAQQHGVTAASW